MLKEKNTNKNTESLINNKMKKIDIWNKAIELNLGINFLTNLNHLLCSLPNEIKKTNKLEVVNRNVNDLKYNELLIAGCDGACFYHCTKGGVQEPECLKDVNKL